MYIAFVLYVLYFFSCFVINVLDLINEKNEKITIQKQIEINYDNNIKNVPIKSYQNEVLNISKTYDYYNSNLIFLKLCVIQGSFWLSDESEKIIIFISLVFFEVTEYMKHYLYLNYLNGNKTAKNKNKNITCIAVICYVIIQKITLGMNQMLFLLVIHSYDFNSSKQQKQKFIKISSLLSSIATFIANYKFSFVVAVYFIEKKYLEKKEEKKEINFSLIFILKRIIINLRLNNTTLFLIFNYLIKMKEEEAMEFISYFLVDFILFVFDYFVYSNFVIIFFD